MSSSRFLEPALSAFARAVIVTAITVATLAGHRSDPVARQPIINPTQDSPPWLAAAVEEHLRTAGMSTPSSAEYVKTTWQTAQSLVPGPGHAADASFVYVVALHYRPAPDPESPEFPMASATEDTTTLVIDATTGRVLTTTEPESWVLDLSAIAKPQVLQFD